MSTDRVGTVRRSPEGVVAVKTDVTSLHTAWLASTAAASHWRSDADVADWEVIYRPPVPPHPVGTVLRRSGKLAYSGKPFWEVAVRSERGWVVTDYTGPWASLEEKRPPDDIDGTWEVVHGNTGN